LLFIVQQSKLFFQLQEKSDYFKDMENAMRETIKEIEEHQKFFQGFSETFNSYNYLVTTQGVRKLVTACYNLYRLPLTEYAGVEECCGYLKELEISFLFPSQNRSSQSGKTEKKLNSYLDEYLKNSLYNIFKVKQIQKITFKGLKIDIKIFRGFVSEPNEEKNFINFNFLTKDNRWLYARFTLKNQSSILERIQKHKKDDNRNTVQFYLQILKQGNLFKMCDEMCEIDRISIRNILKLYNKINKFNALCQILLDFSENIENILENRLKETQDQPRFNENVNEISELKT